MRITFSPQMREDEITITKQGDTLVINGEAFDFSDLPNGATIPTGIVPCEWIVGPVERIDGIIHITIIRPHGRDASEGELFPQPIDAVDGKVI